MKRRTDHIFIIAAIFLAVLSSGCASIMEGLRCTIGNSVKELEVARKKATVMDFNYDLKTCDKRVRDLCIPKNKISIYAEEPKQHLIAVFYTEVNVTPVGIYFTEIDKTKTRIEVSSQSPSVKEFIAEKIFDAIEKPPEKSS